MKIRYYIFLILAFVGCTEKKQAKPISISTQLIANEAPLDSANHFDYKLRKYKENIHLFEDKLLGGRAYIMQGYIEKYHNNWDSCWPVFHPDSILLENFHETKALEDIDGDKILDTVFLIPPFRYCEEGESYYFFNQKLPRLYTISNCCHISNFFVAPDIDEDGVKEIGIYLSGCASSYKSIVVYSLKNGQWVEIGVGIFHIHTRDPAKRNFKSLVKKTGKKKFKICNFDDYKTYWTSHTMQF